MRVNFGVKLIRTRGPSPASVVATLPVTGQLAEKVGSRGKTVPSAAKAGFIAKHLRTA